MKILDEKCKGNWCSTTHRTKLTTCPRVLCSKRHLFHQLMFFCSKLMDLSKGLTTLSLFIIVLHIHNRPFLIFRLNCSFWLIDLVLICFVGVCIARHHASSLPPYGCCSIYTFSLWSKLYGLPPFFSIKEKEK
jgi:hypothetical protein